MKKTLIAFVITAATLAYASASFAQTAPANDELYKAFGEKAGLVSLMDDFMVRLLDDPRTGPHFKPSNQQRIKEQLVEQLCALGGGPLVPLLLTLRLRMTQQQMCMKSMDNQNF